MTALLVQYAKLMDVLSSRSPIVGSVLCLKKRSLKLVCTVSKEYYLMHIQVNFENNIVL